LVAPGSANSAKTGLFSPAGMLAPVAGKLSDRYGSRWPVAIGMTLDIRYAVLAGFLPAAVANRITAVIAATGLPTWDDTVLQRNASGELSLIEGLREFREHLGGEPHITRLPDLQSPFEVTEMDLALVTQAITDLAPVR